MARKFVGSVHRAMAVFGEEFYESSKSVEVATLFDDYPNKMAACRPKTCFIYFRISTGVEPCLW
jgi:hypothetical protein